ncbi:hypothetical protein GCM10025858_29680 [Alicyclobacillus sacchari]|nr:hypothetical protein GCM10025858_29680 [Alicyclobacillus sacchari]
MLFERSGVYTDPNRNPSLFASFDDFFDLLALTDVPRIDPHLVDAVANSFKGETVIKMDIGDERNVNLPLNLLNGFRSIARVDSDPDNLARPPTDEFAPPSL